MKIVGVSKEKANNVIYRGKEMEVLKMTLASKVPYENAVENMTEYMDKIISRRVKKYTYQVVFRFQPAGLFRSSSFFTDNVHMPNLDEYHDTSGFQYVDKILVNRLELPSSEGGKDPHNDCLYNAIKYALGDMYHKQFPKTPKTLKTWLDLKRDNPIDYTQIPILEKKMNIRINVVGDYHYTSPLNISRSVTLKLEDGHYTYKANSKIYKVLYQQSKEDIRLVYFRKQGDDILTYDGEKESILSNTDEQQLKGKRGTGFVYKQNTEGNMKENYDLYMEQIEDLKRITNGKIDIAKHGFSIKITALNLFYTMSKVFEYDDMDELEMSWIRKTKMCGLMLARPHTAQMNVYDVKSFYPSILASTASFPQGKPVYKQLTQAQFDSLPYYEYGIYRVKINEKQVNRCLFKINPHHHYTHSELKLAKSLGYDMKVISDNSANACLYKRRVTGSQIFGPYVHYLYPMKEKHKNPLIKSLLNILWGALCQKKYEYEHSSQKQVTINHIDKVEIYPNNVETHYIVKTEKEYKMPYARLGVFLTGKGRVQLANIMRPISDEIYRVHTDGFYTTAEVKTENNSRLGTLVFEEKGMFEVKNMSKPLRVH